MKTMLKSILRISLLVIWFGVSISYADQFVEVTVEKGDCLTEISEKWLQFPKEWPKIAEINNLRNPHLIHPGDRIIIPVDMLKGLPLNGVVTFVQGDVKIYDDEQQKTIPIRLNDIISEGRRIITGNDGSVRVQFEDGYAFLIRSDTSLQIIQANKKSASRPFFQLWLSIGRIISRIKRATGVDARFEVETPSAVAAVRGTEFRASVDALEDTRCEVLLGSLSLQAADAEIQVKEGEGSLVRKGEIPSPPSRLLRPPIITIPSNRIARLPVEPALEPVEGAFRYRVTIATDPEFNGVHSNILLETHEKLVLNEIPDGVYFLRARSIDRAGLEGIDSQPVEFSVRIHPLPPHLSSPGEQAVLRSGSVPFSWDSVPGVEQYRIQVQKDGLLHVTDEPVTGTTHLVREFRPAAPTAYQVRIRSIAADEYQGSWSDVTRFLVVPPPPAPEIEPTGKTESRLRITSKAVDEPFLYEFQVSRDPQFNDTVFAKTSVEPEIVLEKPADPGTYYVRTAFVSSGFRSDSSPVTSFEVKEDSTLLSVVLFVAFVLALILPVSFLFPLLV